MDRRTKILATLFGAVAAYALISGLVYPEWIEPLLKLDQEIAVRQNEYDELKAVEDEVGEGKKGYKGYVSRVGSFDIDKVTTAIRAQLNELIEKHKLQGANVSPSRPTKDRKTGLDRMSITVTAVGKLESAVEFLKDVSELPQLVRVGNAAIYPASRSRKQRGRDRMNIRVPIEVMVLPRLRIVGRINEEELVQPESFVRHADQDYALIWSMKPFTEPIPLRANAGRDVNRKQGQSARLSATATGGDGEYTFKWEPEDGLNDATIANPTIDTSTAFTQTYTVRVTDASGETSTDSVAVVIRETRAKPGEETSEPVQPTRVERWKDRKYMQLCMTLLHTTDAGRVSELMISNNKRKQTEYYTAGDEFDGGELVFVHPRGGVVLRNDEYFLYTIGTWLDQDVSLSADAAVDYPDLKKVAEWHRESVKEMSEAKQDAAAVPADETGKTASAAPATEKDEKSGDAESSGVEKPEPRESGRVAAPDAKNEESDKTEAGQSAKKTGPKSRLQDRKRSLPPEPDSKKRPRQVRSKRKGS
ncbi:MAG: hypothetical protein JSU86_16160 [Phycisphaerales bacterium]|nr:MAG: hypothetical protein JSU86_16160 [Phycisphaerales bacterium]